MTTTTLPTHSQKSILDKKILPGVTLGTLIVIAVMALSFALMMTNIQAIGNANEYYTAAVKSMLQSWSNFFFVAAEPGGSVTVDKPPLGLWVEAVFAYFLGVSGFSVSLPNILAGIFSIPLLYSMVKKYSGELAGIIAGFVMAITPVFIATNRNNTMDGMLVFTLLLAAWAFIQATESGKLRWLLLGAFIVGLGFNIKMLEAFLPLPAFYALYFFGSKEGWIKKIINLAIATVLLVAVSFSWAVAVDLTPAENRPYIGSSDNNTVMGLIFGHNGISRLENTRGGGGTPPSGTQPDRPANQGTQPQQNPNQGQLQSSPQQALTACENLTQGSACSFTAQNGNTINGSCNTPPNQSQLACTPQGINGQVPSGQMNNGRPDGQNGNGGGASFSNETGSPGVFRFFTSPLSKQMSWLLPFAIISVLLALFAAKIRLPVESGIHKALIIWGSWLMTCVVFFSMVSGIFHSYYVIMLTPALGAMVSIGFVQFWNWSGVSKWATVGLVLSACATLGFQLFAAKQYNEFSLWMLGTGILLGLGILLMFVSRRAAYTAILVAMVVVPTYWSVKTVTTDSNNRLPTAYSGQNGDGRDGFMSSPSANDDGRESSGNNTSSQLVDFLQANTQGMKYMVAVPSSQQGASLVIETGRAVLYMGGFSGQDQVVTSEDLAQLVANGDLRYILYGGDRGGNQDISNWLSSSCTLFNGFGTNQGSQGQQTLGNQQTNLYECK